MDARAASYAWMALIVLSIAGTALAVVPPDWLPGSVAGLAILAIAWIKARLILLHYLGLANAPRWRGGAMAAIALAALAFAGLWLAG